MIYKTILSAYSAGNNYVEAPIFYPEARHDGPQPEPYPDIPNNQIWYKASAKLTETTSGKSAGFHYNRIDGTLVSHTFENGEGIIEYQDDITTIGTGQTTDTYRGLFSGCNLMTEVILPKTVTNIGNSMFSNCPALSSITFPNTILSIEPSAFYNTAFTEFIVPDTCTSVGLRCFSGCSNLTNVVLGSGVTALYDLFTNSNITSLTLKSPTVVDVPLWYQAFDYILYLYVPANLVTAYLESYSWNSFRGEILPIS